MTATAAPPPASPSSPLPSSSHPPPSSPLLPPRHAAGAGIVYALGGGLVLFSLAAAPFFIVPWLPRARFGALPYLATSPSRASRLLAALPPGAVGAGRSFVDLGSGDGVLVLAAAAAGCRAVGVELNPTLHAVASARALLARLRGGGGGGGSATFLLGSMFDTSVREFDVVMAFGVVPLMPRIAAKLEAEASPVAVFVSRKFELPPGAAPSFTLARVVADDMFVYVREGSPGWPPAGEGGGGGGQGGGGGAGAGAREQTARGLR